MTGFHGEEINANSETTPASGFALPEFPLLWRGAALGVLSLILGRVAIGGAKTSLLLLPLSLLLVLGAAIAAWASAIHLTGGARHDDHPWI